MQVSVEKVSNVERRLVIVVPAAEVEMVYDKYIKQFASEIKLKGGFRRGSPATVNYVKKHYAPQARQEALGEVMKTALIEALTEQKIRPINQPRIEPKITTANEPLEFSASFEILPEIPPIQFKLDTVEKLAVDIEDKDIDYVIAQLQKQHATWKKVERAAERDDRIVIDYQAEFEGKTEEESKVQNHPLQLGSANMIPGFEDGLIGAVAGETRTLHLQFPENYHDAKRAGKPVTFAITVKEVIEGEIPPVNAEFIEKLGVKGDETELKNQIKKTLEGERDRMVQEKLKEQVFKTLLEQNPIDIPNSLVKQEATNIYHEIYPHRDQHGGSHHEHSDEELSPFIEVAKKRVAVGLLISEYAKQSHVKADVSRVEKRAHEIAASYEMPQEVVNWLLKSERRAGLEAQVVEEQVMEKLLQEVPTTEKRISYADLKGLRI